MDSINLNTNGKEQLNKLIEANMKYIEYEEKRLKVFNEIEILERNHDRALDNGKRKLRIKKDLDQKRVDLEKIKHEQLKLYYLMEDLKKELKPQFKESIEKK